MRSPLKARQCLHGCLEPTVHAQARMQVDFAVVVGVPRFLLDLFRCVDGVDEAALGAFELLVPAHQRRGHRTGGDHERLGLESADDERQDERHHDGLDRIAVPLAGGCGGFDRRGLWVPEAFCMVAEDRPIVVALPLRGPTRVPADFLG